MRCYRLAKLLDSYFHCVVTVGEVEMQWPVVVVVMVMATPKRVGTKNQPIKKLLLPYEPAKTKQTKKQPKRNEQKTSQTNKQPAKKQRKTFIL